MTSKLRNFIRDIRTFCQQSAALLDLADRVLADHGWETAQSQNIAFANNSASIAFPKRWFPTELFRFYKPPGRFDRLAFASLLLDDDPDGTYTLDEPLASAGVLYLQADQDLLYQVKEYWWSRFHGYAKGSWSDHGAYCVFRPREVWRDHVAQRPEWYPFDDGVRKLTSQPPGTRPYACGSPTTRASGKAPGAAAVDRGARPNTRYSPPPIASTASTTRLSAKCSSSWA